MWTKGKQLAPFFESWPIPILSASTHNHHPNWSGAKQDNLFRIVGSIPYYHLMRCHHRTSITSTTLTFFITISCTIPLTACNVIQGKKHSASCGDPGAARPIGRQEFQNGHSYWLRAEITLTDSQPHVSNSNSCALSP